VIPAGEEVTPTFLEEPPFVVAAVATHWDQSLGARDAAASVHALTIWLHPRASRFRIFGNFHIHPEVFS
jgi:hypothetical protein